MSIFRRKKKPLSADVIALLAQAHEIHKAELEFARDETREWARAIAVREMREMGEKVRDILFSGSGSMRSQIGVLLVEAGVFTAAEWDQFVFVKDIEQRERAVAGLQQARSRESRLAGYKHESAGGVISSRP